MHIAQPLPCSVLDRTHTRARALRRRDDRGAAPAAARRPGALRRAARHGRRAGADRAPSRTTPTCPDHAAAADRGRQALRGRWPASPAGAPLTRAGSCRSGRSPPRLARLRSAARRDHRARGSTCDSRPGRAGFRRFANEAFHGGAAPAAGAGWRTRRRSPRCTGAACPTRTTRCAAIEEVAEARRAGRASSPTGAARCSRSARRCGSTRAPGIVDLLRDTDLAAAVYVGDDVDRPRRLPRPDASCRSAAGSATRCASACARTRRRRRSRRRPTRWSTAPRACAGCCGPCCL